MTDTTISPLRLRMIEDMTIREFVPVIAHLYRGARLRYRRAHSRWRGGVRRHDNDDCPTGGRAMPVPATLARFARRIAATEWRPRRRDYEEVLDQLSAELPDALNAPGPIDEIIDSSDFWGSIDSLSDSWFEEGQEVQDLLADSHDDLDEELLHRVLDEIVEPRRAKWTERFVWTALLLKEASADHVLPWPQITVLARELAHGRSAAEIPLMGSIALTTIVAHDATNKTAAGRARARR